MNSVRFAVFGVGLAALSFFLGTAVGVAIARKQAEREIRRLRAQVAWIRAELEGWMRR